MWNPIRDYPLSLLSSASSSLLGSLALFFGAGSLAYLLVAFDPSEGFSMARVLFAWIYTLITSCIFLFGLPMLLVHVWTLHKLFYTEESRMKLFFVAFATHTVMFVVAVWFERFEPPLLRSSMAIGVLAVLYCVLKKRGVFRREATTLLY